MVADMRALSIFTHDIKNNIMPLTMVEADLVDLRASLAENWRQNWMGSAGDF
jgi:hypothetical protein